MKKLESLVESSLIRYAALVTAIVSVTAEKVIGRKGHRGTGRFPGVPLNFGKSKQAVVAAELIDNRKVV